MAACARTTTTFAGIKGASSGTLLDALGPEIAEAVSGTCARTPAPGRPDRRAAHALGPGPRQRQRLRRCQAPTRHARPRRPPPQARPAPRPLRRQRPVGAEPRAQVIVVRPARGCRPGRRRRASRAGSVGVHRGSTERKDSGSASMMPTSTSPTIRPPTGPSRSPSWRTLGLLEDVEPERRLGLPPVLGQARAALRSARARRGRARRPRRRRGRLLGRAGGRGWPATRSRCPAAAPETCVGRAISEPGSRASMRLARCAGG